MPGPDRPDYWLGEPMRPLFWLKDNHQRQIDHLVVCARWQGTQIEPNVRDFPIGIAYVTNKTLITDEAVDFAKCAYVAIGIAHETSVTGLPTPTGQIQMGRIGRAFGRGKSD